MFEREKVYDSVKLIWQPWNMTALNTCPSLGFYCHRNPLVNSKIARKLTASHLFLKQ